MTDGVVVVEREEPIAVVRLNRPEQLNALSEELMGELVDALEALDRDGVRATAARALGAARLVAA